MLENRYPSPMKNWANRLLPPISWSQGIRYPTRGPSSDDFAVVSPEGHPLWPVWLKDGIQTVPGLKVRNMNSSIGSLLCRLLWADER
jgi:hypothetical protein